MWAGIVLAVVSIGVGALTVWASRKETAIPNWCLLTVAAIFLIGILPIGLFENWREVVLTAPARVLTWFSGKSENDVWIHPTLSADERQKAIAKCEMKMLEWYSEEKIFLAANYMNACMKSKGFTQVHIPANTKE